MFIPSIDVSFLRELEKDIYNPISKAQERRLILTYQQEGDLEALQSLVKHNLRFIVRHVVGGANIGMDIIQAAVLGFKRAVKKFDLKKTKPASSGRGSGGYKLITYAKRWIKYEIQEYGRKHCVVAPSHYAHYNAVAIEKIIARVGRDEHAYTDKEVIAKTGLTQRRINTARKALKCILPLSIDGTDDTVSGFRLRTDSVCPHEEAVRSEENELIKGVLRLLPCDESLVIRKRYLEDGSSYRQLAIELDCSHETVRKIESRGLSRLQSILR